MGGLREREREREYSLLLAAPPGVTLSTRRMRSSFCAKIMPTPAVLCCVCTRTWVWDNAGGKLERGTDIRQPRQTTGGRHQSEQKEWHTLQCQMLLPGGSRKFLTPTWFVCEKERIGDIALWSADAGKVSRDLSPMHVSFFGTESPCLETQHFAQSIANTIQADRMW